MCSRVDLILFKINCGNNTTSRVYDYEDIATNYLDSSPNFFRATITAALGVCKVFCEDAPNVFVPCCRSTRSVGLLPGARSPYFVVRSQSTASGYEQLSSHSLSKLDRLARTGDRQLRLGVCAIGAIALPK